MLLKKIFDKIKSNKASAKLLTPEDSSVFRILKQGDIAIDCGASVGDVTTKMAAQGATVYAFEPNPITFKHLQKRFENTPTVTCLNQGVLDKNSQLPFYFHQDIDLSRENNPLVAANGSSLLAFKRNVNKENFVEVEVIDLAAFIEQLPQRVKLLKIDVEGVEYEILNRLIDTKVYKQIDQILVETHEKKIPELRPKHKQLQEKITKEHITNINLNWM